MNVLIQFLGEKESGPVFTYELVKGMIKNNCTVYAILSDQIENKDKWLKLLKENNIYFLEHRPQKRKPVTTGVYFMQELKKIKNKFTDIKFDLVVRTFVDSYDDMILKQCKYQNVVNFCHDPIPHTGVSSYQAKKTRNRIAKCNKIVIMTKKYIDVIKKDYKKADNDIIVVNHGILPYAHDEKLKQAKYNANYPVNFLFFGRIDQYKGVDILCSAFDKLSSKKSNIKLTIAGSGKLEEYNCLISKLVNVHNRYILEQEVENFFSENNTVLVLPYKDATQSGVLTIAYEFGVPIIASDSGGLKEQLFDGKVGILVEPNDEEQLMNAMEAVCNQNIYNNEVEKIVEYRKNLSWDTIAKVLISECSN